MKNIVISGYATLDYVIQMYDQFNGTGTCVGEVGVSGAWPRAGGAILYASQRIAKAGHNCKPLTWIGTNRESDIYIEACQAAGVSVDAIDRSPEGIVHRCILIYQPTGAYGCVLAESPEQECKLSNEQIQSVKAADVICIAVGPPQATQQILSLRSKEQRLVWIVKIDEPAFPKEMRQVLADDADLIFCNASEREFVEQSRGRARKSDQLIIETLGSAGVLVDDNKSRAIVPTEPLQTSDTTGAGDTLAGETLAQFLQGDIGLIESVEAGMDAARRLLASRV